MAGNLLHLSTKNKLLICLDEEVVQKYSNELLSFLPLFVTMSKTELVKSQKFLKLMLHSQGSKSFLMDKLKSYAVDELKEMS